MKFVCLLRRNDKILAQSCGKHRSLRENKFTVSNLKRFIKNMDSIGSTAYKQTFAFKKSYRHHLMVHTAFKSRVLSCDIKAVIRAESYMKLN